jgi:hypothetical protein
MQGRFANEDYVLFLSLSCANLGLNMQAAKQVIFTCPWWNPAVEDQAIMAKTEKLPMIKGADHYASPIPWAHRMVATLDVKDAFYPVKAPEGLRYTSNHLPAANVVSRQGSRWSRSRRSTYAC